MSAPDPVTQKKNHRYQRIIGIITFVHGPLLILSGILYSIQIQPSYSQYFFTCVWFVFALMLAVPGISLIFYVGYPNDNEDIFSDKTLTTIGGLAAICIVLFPTLPSAPNSCDGYQYYTGLFPERIWPIVNGIHYFAAMVFFGLFAYLFLKRFRRSNEDPTSQKAKRNQVYLTSAWTIILCMLAMLAYGLFLDEYIPDNKPFIFLCEFVAGVAIAAGLITKSEWIFPDRDEV